jgi:tetratricopeptide (TPR) repeat protein
MRSVLNKRCFVNSRIALLFLIIPILIGGCSAQKNTVTSKAFHNLASHYNGYYYANEEMGKVERGYRKSMVDDYNRILRLYPKLDSTQSKTYEKELQEVVKMASLAIQRHQNSKWVDDSYVLVGKARLYSLDWANAIETFKYVNTTAKDKDARHEGILNLIRTFTEHKEYNNARGAADFLQKQPLNITHQKQLYLEKAYLAQVQNEHDNMVRNLALAAPLLKKKADRPGRIYFIIGQVYQKLGFESEAYNYYKKCLATHPEYEVDFYARLYLAQVTEISKSKNINSARKSFKRLLKDSKNRDFKDKIYYEMGVFEYKQKNKEQAIDLFNQSIRAGTNKRVDGEAYLRLGELYYESKKYETSKSYYDSTVASLPKDYEGLAAIRQRNETLAEFVKHLTTIRWQDSLLVMAAMDTATLRTHIDSVLKANTKPISTSKKKKKASRIEIESVASSIFDAESDSQEASTWYFASASAVALGQSEFIRVWGSVPLEDNWRRSQRASVQSQASIVQASSSSANKTENVETETPKVNSTQVAFTQIVKELPNTDEKKKEALKKIEEAYYHLGDIYSLKLNEPINAIETYNKLLLRFPDNAFEPEVLYRLYILAKEIDTFKADEYAARLKEEHPASSWAKLLLNPNYLADAGKTVVRQKVLYAEAYENFQLNRLDSTQQILAQAQTLGVSIFTPNLLLLEILLAGKTKSVAEYATQLEVFIKQYPDHELTSYAKKLLAAAQQKDSGGDQVQKISFSKKLEMPHAYAISYKTNPVLEAIITKSLTDFHNSSFAGIPFSITQIQLQNDQSICLVTQFTDRLSAVRYINLFNEKLATMNTLKTYNFNNFVITSDNLETLKRTQLLNEYLAFYTRYYQTENP